MSNPARLLLEWDRAGWLARELRVGSKRWARVLPQRAPEQPPPCALPAGTLGLIAGAMLHPDADGLIVEAPGAWARLQLLQPELAPLLQALARGASVARLGRLVPLAPEPLYELLLMLAWCGLLRGAAAEPWAAHDLFLHSRTRRGFSADPIGRVAAFDVPGHLGSPRTATGPCASGPCIALVRGDSRDLSQSFGDVLLSRQSVREHGQEAMSLMQLGRFLWHALAEQPRGQRTWRPYPSGGRLYALRAFLVVAQCGALTPAVYEYDPVAHQLMLLTGSEAAPGPLLADAAASARAHGKPHALLVFCADYGRQRKAYGDLGYSLLLKEVGAVMQISQMVAAALGLAACPLGTADALAFARLTHIDAAEWPMVGELLLGAP